MRVEATNGANRTNRQGKAGGTCGTNKPDCGSWMGPGGSFYKTNPIPAGQDTPPIPRFHHSRIPVPSPSCETKPIPVTRPIGRSAFPERAGAQNKPNFAVLAGRTQGAGRTNKANFPPDVRKWARTGKPARARRGTTCVKQSQFPPAGRSGDGRSRRASVQNKANWRREQGSVTRYPTPGRYTFVRNKTPATKVGFMQLA